MEKDYALLCRGGKGQAEGTDWHHFVSRAGWDVQEAGRIEQEAPSSTAPCLRQVSPPRPRLCRQSPDWLGRSASLW